MTDRPGDDENQNEDDPGEPEALGAAAPLTVGRESRADAKHRRKAEKQDSATSSSRGLMSRALLLGGFVVVALVLLALVPGFISGLKKTPRDRVGISYGGGPFEGTHYQRIVQPGSNLFFNGFSDPLYLYPSDQVNYIISKSKDVGAEETSDSVTAPTKDRVQVTYEIAVYFKLNTDLLREFHEELGLRYKAYTANGWNALMRNTFRQQIENTLQEETRRVDVAELYGNADVLVEVQNQVQKKLTERLRDALGRPFFCSPTYEPGGECGDPTIVIKKVEVPKSVAKAFENNRTSEIEIQTKTNEIEQSKAEAEAIAALGLTGQEYNLLKAIESGQIKFWVLPNDGGVTLNASGAPTSNAAPSG